MSLRCVGFEPKVKTMTTTIRVMCSLTGTYFMEHWNPQSKTSLMRDHRSFETFYLFFRVNESLIRDHPLLKPVLVLLFRHFHSIPALLTITDTLFSILLSRPCHFIVILFRCCCSVTDILGPTLTLRRCHFIPVLLFRHWHPSFYSAVLPLSF